MCKSANVHLDLYPQSDRWCATSVSTAPGRPHGVGFAAPKSPHHPLTDSMLLLTKAVSATTWQQAKSKLSRFSASKWSGPGSTVLSPSQLKGFSKLNLVDIGHSFSRSVRSVAKPCRSRRSWGVGLSMSWALPTQRAATKHNRCNALGRPTCPSAPHWDGRSP